MIRITNDHGQKEIFLNIYQRIYSSTFDDIQYIPNSQRSVGNQVRIYLENVLSGYKTNHLLSPANNNSKRSRGNYFYFTLGDGAGEWNILEKGVYKYTISNSGVSSETQNNVMDSGLFHIINSDTFEDEYINETEIVIPAVTVYKPS